MLLVDSTFTHGEMQKSAIISMKDMVLLQQPDPVADHKYFE